MLSFSHTLILSYSHALILSYSHSLILSVLILSFSHTLILSFSHSLILSYSHTFILSFSHTLILSFSHTLILSSVTPRRPFALQESTKEKQMEDTVLSASKVPTAPLLCPTTSAHALQPPSNPCPDIMQALFVSCVLRICSPVPPVPPACPLPAGALPWRRGPCHRSEREPKGIFIPPLPSWHAQLWHAPPDPNPYTKGFKPPANLSEQS